MHMAQMMPLPLTSSCSSKSTLVVVVVVEAILLLLDRLKVGSTNMGDTNFFFSLCEFCKYVQTYHV